MNTEKLTSFRPPSTCLEDSTSVLASGTRREAKQFASRPPIVAVVGHIDHGKSTLLDYIRKSNITDTEAGGITQRLSAYEAEHVSAESGRTHSITFLDTPGHEAFRAMRLRGLEVADIAILVVSAEDGVKPQTLEAFRLIEEVKKPYIVALTKADKPTANIVRAKQSLLENGIYLEGMGGEVPFVIVSSKTGAGIPELLDLIVLAAEMEGLHADATRKGEGVVIEAHRDTKRGNTATVIVLNGSIRTGEYAVSGESFTPVRIIENFLGKSIKEAFPGSPIRIIGFSSLPIVGARWKTVSSKKEAMREVKNAEEQRNVVHTVAAEDATRLILPIIIKSDFAGIGDAVLHELEKLPKYDNLETRIVSRGVGAISEGDVRLVGSGKNPGIIVGFNVKVEKEAQEVADRLGVEIQVFDIIYKLTEWLGAQLEKRRPREHMSEKIGSAKVLKFFSSVKDRAVIGCKAEGGILLQGTEIKLFRRDVEIGHGEIVGLQVQKVVVQKVEAGAEFGALIRVSIKPVLGDRIEAFETIIK